ncbi:GAF domain-containing protein [Pararhizobium arenae]|uniref:GAF domain-containing protein n=1 Tax=Pararhizobium arenae TaxID=1856850 RepID=UPI000B27C5E8|nr:GAF domain-containing protein [Pararhizobium arenae]
MREILERLLREQHETYEDLKQYIAKQGNRLSSVIDTIADAPFPMFIVIGADRRLIYNEAYVPILGSRHPFALGRPFFEVWPEVTEHVAPVIDDAFLGKSTLFQDMKAMLNRPTLQPAWFTFSYSPIRDEDGNIAAALCVCSETTEAVTARLRQAFLMDLQTAFHNTGDASEIIEIAQGAIGSHLGVSRVGYGWVDDSERYFTTPSNWTDGTVERQSGTHDLAAFGPAVLAALRGGVSLVICDSFTDARVSDPQSALAFQALQIRSVVTVSLIRSGRFVAALYVHNKEPRDWTEQELALIREVADRTWSALERAYAQANLHALAQRQSFLLTLSDQLRPLSSAEEIKQVSAQLLGEFLSVGRVGYGEIDASQEYVTVERDWSNGEMPSLGGETRRLEIFGPAIIAVLKGGRMLRLDSVYDNPVSVAYADGYASIGTRSLLVAPLLKEDRLVAILYVHEGEPRRWTDEEVAIASEVADRTWALIERARAESALRAVNATLEERVNQSLAERRIYASIVEDTDSPIQMIDRNYRFLGVNPAAKADYERVFGIRPHTGQSLLELLSHVPPQRDGAKAVWDRALAGEAFDQTGWWGEGDVERRAYEMRFRPVLAEDGTVGGAYLIGRDITELLKEQERLSLAEEQLRQAQKLEAIGQLTGGVAHDFNNLLTPIIGSLDILQRKQLGGEREQRMVAGAAQAAERARLLVQRLLAFARRQPLQATAVDVRELVHEMAGLISSTTGPQIHIAVDVWEHLPPVLADRNQLEMALLNLAVNARDAMPDGGTLRITAQASSGRETRPSELAKGDYICLSVSDTGSGMDDQTLKRATEPFFSTKGLGKGTGLGLSMVHGLALQSGGMLTIKSREGVGTNVEIWLPVSSGSLYDMEHPPTVATTALSGVALLVDDEGLVRLSTAEMLRELGYDVIEAESAEDALKLLGHGLTPRLLVTDHLMPGMTGTELARSIIAARPDVQVLVVSGYSDVEDVAPDLPRLTKPFRREDLVNMLTKPS